MTDVNTQEEVRKTALLISVYKGNEFKDLCDEHLKELELLVDTYGVDTVLKMPCPVRKFEAATLITEGKLEELKSKAEELDVDMIIFDDQLAPSQQRNLELFIKIPVLDRTAIILGVFAQRARTKEARLQIELAKVKYEAPRLKRLWTHLSRQTGTGSGGSGSGGFTKGEGEKQIEIDRRILKSKIDQLQKEIDEVEHNRITQRGQRAKSEIPVFAIIGYTNAGKSTLLNALTDAKVFVEDKLFATLDTTTRKFMLPDNQEILLIDTVGFIRKLPHLLVAAFRSTLEEAFHSDFLLHLIDVSNPAAEEQAATTFEVLKELNVEKKPVITVLNKIDQCKDMKMIMRMRILYPKCVTISALKKQGFNELFDLMLQELNKRRSVVELRIPQKDYHKVSEVMRLGSILQQEYEENDVLLKVNIPNSLVGKLQEYLVINKSQEDNY